MKEIDQTSALAQPGIKRVATIGKVGYDGTMLAAVVVEYNVDLTGARVSAEDYELTVFKPREDDPNVVNYGGGKPGDVTVCYVNDAPAISPNGGSGTGKYVILELYTDYMRSSDTPAVRSLAAGVKQVRPITAGGVTIAPGEEVVNYVTAEHPTPRGMIVSNDALPGTFKVVGLEQYKLYTNTPGIYGADGPALTVRNCFNEKTGETYDYEMGYALWVPEDWHADGRYALVTVDHTIRAGSHPFEALLTNYGPTYFMSDAAQDIVKKAHGLDGLVVVVPLIIERVDDNSCVPAMWMALCDLWDMLIEKYSVDENHVYGAGQSMGGMLLMQTNTNRDNYFAGMLCYGNQWGQNYYKDSVFTRGMTDARHQETAENTPRHYPSTAGTKYIWDYHYGDNGEKVYEDHDPYNFYYLISDDNLMVFGGNGNHLSIDVWNEMSFLYQDTVGYEIPWLNHINSRVSIEEQNEYINAFLRKGNNLYKGVEMGLWRMSWEDPNGANDATAIWSRRITAAYEWLLKQDRRTELARPKLDINKPFVPADEQLRTEDRVVTNFHDKDTGEPIYYMTAKQGAGTRFYNTSWLRLGKNVSADANPGWLPAGMSWEKGVCGAKIQSVAALNNGGKLAVAVEYDVDMEHIYVQLKGDRVIDSKGQPRPDDFVTIDPYEFVVDGASVPCAITNLYVNDAAAVKEGAERLSGAGRYVIVETDADYAEAVGAIQRTTVITDKYIAGATSRLYS